MAPSEYLLRLQKGIAGGFVPPTPDAVYNVTCPKDHSDLNITCTERPDSTRSLQSFTPKSCSHAENEALIDELHSILKVLPMEVPPGSEDIYSLNTSITWGSDDLMWFNGGPGGCGGGTSSTQPTDEEKKKFKRAVEIVEKLVKE